MLIEAIRSHLSSSNEEKENIKILLRLSLAPVIVFALGTYLVYVVVSPRNPSDLYSISGVVFSAWFVIYSLIIPRYLPEIQRLHTRAAEARYRIDEGTLERSISLQKDMLTSSINPIQKIASRVFRSIILNILLLLSVIVSILDIPNLVLPLLNSNTQSNRLFVETATISTIMAAVILLTIYLGVLIFRMGMELVIVVKITNEFVETQYVDTETEGESDGGR